MVANRKFIPEILKEINEDTSKIVQYRDSGVLKLLLPYAFLSEKKFNLPEGTPPFQKDPAPLGMSPSNFVQELRRLYIFTPERDLPALRKESLFIQLLEGLHPSEAEILIAVKDQTLDKMFPNITVDLLIENGFLPETARKPKVEKTKLEKVADTAQVVKRKVGRPAKNSGG